MTTTQRTAPPTAGSDRTRQVVVTLAEVFCIVGTLVGVGVIGTRIAKAAAPDGYTLVMATSGSIAINPTLYVNPGYEPRKDLAPIGLISSTPIVLMAHPTAPETTLADVIAAAKRNPGTLNIGTPPPGTLSEPGTL